MAMERRIEFAWMLGKLLTHAGVVGLQVIITHLYRGAEEQAALYAKGRTAPGPIVTNCDGVHTKSKHQVWRAVDLAIVEGGKIAWEHPGYADLGEYWATLGGTWGGTFKRRDEYHYEY